MPKSPSKAAALSAAVLKSFDRMRSSQAKVRAATRLRGGARKPAFAALPGIRPKQLRRRKKFLQLAQDANGAVETVNVGGANFHERRHVLDITPRVACVVDLLAGIVAARTDALGRYHAPVVGDARRRLVPATGPSAVHFHYILADMA